MRHRLLVMASARRVASLAIVAIGALATSIGHAQTASRIRGTIIAVDATTLAVKSREGQDLKLRLADNASVAVAKAVRFEDIKDGDFVGATTRRGPGGEEVALEVHFLPPTATAGLSASDLQPNARMTNANVRRKVVGTASHELTVDVAGAEQRIVVPDGTPIVRTVPGTRADLVPGESVFVSARDRERRHDDRAARAGQQGRRAATAVTAATAGP
ncbi:MAG: hypothetical protein ABI585_00660 [Betaproteobacteria bacterium]